MFRNVVFDLRTCQAETDVYVAPRPESEVERSCGHAKTSYYIRRPYMKCGFVSKFWCSPSKVIVRAVSHHQANLVSDSKSELPGNSYRAVLTWQHARRYRDLIFLLQLRQFDGVQRDFVRGRLATLLLPFINELPRAKFHLLLVSPLLILASTICQTYNVSDHILVALPCKCCSD